MLLSSASHRQVEAHDPRCIAQGPPSLVQKMREPRSKPGLSGPCSNQVSTSIFKTTQAFGRDDVELTNMPMSTSQAHYCAQTRWICMAMKCRLCCIDRRTSNFPFWLFPRTSRPSRIWISHVEPRPMWVSDRHNIRIGFRKRTASLCSVLPRGRSDQGLFSNSFLG